MVYLGNFNYTAR